MKIEISEGDKAIVLFVGTELNISVKGDGIATTNIMLNKPAVSELIEALNLLYRKM